jgi:hypothetical protein
MAFYSDPGMMVWTHSTPLIGFAMSHNELSQFINGNGVDQDEDYYDWFGYRKECISYG